MHVRQTEKNVAEKNDGAGKVAWDNLKSTFKMKWVTK